MFWHSLIDRVKKHGNKKLIHFLLINGVYKLTQKQASQELNKKAFTCIVLVHKKYLMFSKYCLKYKTAFFPSHQTYPRHPHQPVLMTYLFHTHARTHAQSSIVVMHANARIEQTWKRERERENWAKNEGWRKRESKQRE